MNELFDACGFIDRIFMQVSYGEIIALFWEVEIRLFTKQWNLTKNTINDNI